MNLNDIKTGDSFVCIGKPETNLFGWMTRRIALSDFVHAGTFFWEGRHLMCAEIRIEGEHSKTTGYVVEPWETRCKSLKKQYDGTYWVSHENTNNVKEAHILEVLSGFVGSEYGYRKAFPIALNLSLKRDSVVCSTIPERVCELMGYETHDWHPADVVRNGWVESQIL